MITNGQKLMKLYDETASMIAEIYYKGSINEEEMIFLLNLLDIVIIQKDNSDILDVLKKWWNANLNEETNKTIKSTLINIDFKNNESININTKIIKDLIG